MSENIERGSFRRSGRWVLLGGMSLLVAAYVVDLVSVEPEDALPLSLGSGWRDSGTAVDRPPIRSTIIGAARAEKHIAMRISFFVPSTINATLVLQISGLVPNSCKAELWKEGANGLVYLQDSEPPTYERHPSHSNLTLVAHRVQPSEAYDELSVSCDVLHSPQRLSFSQRRLRVERRDVPENIDSHGFALQTLPRSVLFLTAHDEVAHPQTVNGNPVQDQGGTQLEPSVVIDWTREDLAHLRDMTLVAVGALLGLVGASLVELLK